MIEHITFQTESKRTLAAVYYPGETHAPGVIFCHGFGSSKESAKGGEIGADLTDHGFHVLRFDFHGHGESDGVFADVTITKAIEDLRAAIAFLKTKTSGKIGVFGSSFGGTVALLTASTQPVDCLAICAAPGDMVAVNKQIDRALLKKRYPDFAPRFLSLSDPFFQEGALFMQDAKQHNTFAAAAHITCPVLFLHGDQDTVVPLEQSEQLAALVSGPKEFAVIEGADHFLKHSPYKETRKLIRKKTVEWFVKWLK